MVYLVFNTKKDGIHFPSFLNYIYDLIILYKII